MLPAYYKSAIREQVARYRCSLASKRRRFAYTKAGMRMPSLMLLCNVDSVICAFQMCLPCHLCLFLIFLSHSPLFPPLRAPLQFCPQQRACEKSNRCNERKTPSSSHPLDHLDYNRCSCRAHQTPYQIVCSGGCRRTHGIQIDQHGTHDVE